MRIQPITTNQPNCKGKLIFKESVNTKALKTLPEPLTRQIAAAEELIKEKPYDVFVSKNKNNPDFFDVAANKSFKDAQKVKGYTVKIQSSIMGASFVDAVKDAVEMYEKYISRSVKG